MWPCWITNGAGNMRKEEETMRSYTWMVGIFLSLLLQSAAALSGSRQSDDCRALLQFADSFNISEYNYCDGNNYPKTTSWKNGTDCCSWDGVTCDHDDDVIEIDLSCSKLHGAFPSNSTLFSLPKLRRLNLNDNDFRGSEIPSRFSVFAAGMTHLDLSRSLFVGRVPPEISHLSKLVALNLSGNGLILEDRTLKGLVQNLTQLRRLDLGYTNMSQVSPDSFVNLSSSLNHLSLSFCSLQGVLVSSIFHLPQLNYLDLSFNNLGFNDTPEDSNWISPLMFLYMSYTFHDEVKFNSLLEKIVGLKTTLQHLALSDNPIVGEIQNSIGKLTNLQYLYLSDNSIVGEIPNSIGKLTNLQYLDLSSNSIIGEIPNSIGKLTNLQHLGLSGNPIVGEIPQSIGKLTNLQYLSLSGTSIMGSLPLTFSNLENLSYLYLQGIHNLNGTVDFEIFAKMRKMKTLLFPPHQLNVVLRDSGNVSFPELTQLRLSGCNLTKFPYFLSSSKGLQYLDLSKNNITGPIPRWFWTIGNNTLDTLDLSDNLITGFLQPFTWNNLTLLDLHNNRLRGPLPELLLPSVWYIDASNNFLTGAMPTSICRAGNLGSLDLSDNQLSGTIPDCISNLTTLSVLCLSSNRLEGRLPRSISNCTAFELLDIGHNQITDTFPHWFQHSMLYYLDLQSNEFYGPLKLYSTSCPFPTMMAYNLADNALTGQWPVKYFLNSSSMITFIDLSNNKFEGPIPIPPLSLEYYTVSGNMFTDKIPSAICNNVDLVVLDLSNNSLVGSIPRCFENINNSLSILNLRKNYLTDEIPSIFGPNNSLRTVDLSQNNLRGTIPRSLASCKYLEVVDLSSNTIHDVFPSWLAALVNLQVLVLRSNMFHGPVKYYDNEVTDPFPQLRIFDISVNQFSGPLPIEYMAKFKAMMDADITKEKGNLHFASGSNLSYNYDDSIQVVMKGYSIELVKILKVFTTIDLSMNSFHGEIPNIVGDLKALKGLNFSHNHITGIIPSSIGNLTSLEWLDLSSNNLTGEIPMPIARLTFLAYINLSSNRLTGKIPSGPQFNTFTRDQFEGNPGLCGLPLPKLCGSLKSPPPTDHAKDDDEHDGWIDWRVAVAMGYGCGLVFGLSASYLILEITLRPKCLVLWVDRMILRFETRSKKRREVPIAAAARSRHHGR